MKFSEVVKALEEGKKIKLKNWKNAYWYSKDGILINHDEVGEESPTTELFPVDILWILADDWEIMEEPLETFSFGDAVNFLKAGKRVARKNWEEENTFLVLCCGNEVPSNRMKVKSVKDFYMETHKSTVKIAPHIDLKSKDDTYVTGWFASQEDMLADDWYIVE